MSPRSKSKSKSKNKPASKNAKEQPKASMKLSGSSNTASGSPSSAFHTLEIPSAALSPPFHDNGLFRNIDDTDDHSGSPHGTVSEYDSVSNNGSCSGESEDPKEKATNPSHQETVPGLDNDRREKIRLKNERKHQRQRERRAQELHERCSGYLMSRKLESLAEQLVAMGFSHERATLALVLNEGRVEKSVNWLFEGNEEEARNKDSKLGSAAHLKIDISEELAQISAMELRYRCSKQEVERAVVSSEGDLSKVEEMLQTQKRDQPATSPTAEESTDTNNLSRMQEKLMSSASITMQQKRNEWDLNYVKSAVYSEPGTRNLQPMNQPKLLADRRCSGAGSSSALQVTTPAAKLEAQIGISGHEGKGHQQLLREPLVMMQHPQSMNAKQTQVPSISALPSATARWYSSIPGVETPMSNGKIPSNQSVVNQGSEQFYHPVSYKESSVFYNGAVEAMPVGFGGSWSTMGKSPYDLQNTTNVTSPSLASPSSLGLFTGWGSAGNLGAPSRVDWNTGGLMPEFDYTSIDWTLDSNLLASKPSGLWMGLSSLLRNTPGMNGMNDSFISDLRESVVTKEMSASAGLHDWTSPFAGKDMFSLPRQFVTSPSH